MKVTNQIYTNKNQAVSFSSTRRKVEKFFGIFSNNNYTNFFRNDLNWEKFAIFIKNKYKDTSKINIHCFACSDGSEPFSIAMLLHAKMGKDAKKFRPIIASDKDSHFLNKAKKGLIEVTDKDLKLINKYTGKNYKTYLDVDFTNYKIYDKDEGLKFYQAKVKDFIKELVIFKKADILKDIDKIPKDNTVLMGRNVWYYLNPNDRPTLVQKIKNNLGKNSVYISGSFDDGVYIHHHTKQQDVLIHDKLKQNGLVQNDTIERCFEGPNLDEKTYLSNPNFLQKIFIRRTG